MYVYIYIYRERERTQRVPNGYPKSRKWYPEGTQTLADVVID